MTVGLRPLVAPGIAPDPRAMPPQNDTVPLLQVEGLSVAFGKASVLDGVSFSIDRGETVAMVGESGCGKSLTSLAIMRLLPAGARMVSGAVRLLDRDGRATDLCRLGAREMRSVRGARVSMIFQEPMSSLNPLHRVGDQIAEAIRLHNTVSRRAAWAATEELLELVGIPEPRQRREALPHELSGGMRQRVMIAMALACRPDLLIADEPTTALDVTIQAQILDLLRRLQAEMGMSILFITHDLGVVAEVAERVVVMYAGQVVEQGAMRDVLRAPRHPYTRGLLGCVPRPDLPERRGQSLVSIPGMVPDPSRLPAGCRFHPRCAHALPDICDRATPPLEPFAAGRLVRCLRHRELQVARA
jgi:oligopeptide transport system ATP-binding protein